MRRTTTVAFAFALTAVLAACNASAPNFIAGATPTPSLTSSEPFVAQTDLPAAPSMQLPTAGGFAGVLATNASFLSYTQLSASVQNTPPQGAPAFAAAQPLLYVGMLYDATVPASAIMLTLDVPPSVPASSYYLALYDPQRPSLGWQSGFSGPAAPNAARALTFSAAAPQFNRYVQYWFAAYAPSPAQPSPSAAPSISPLVSPTPTAQTLANLQNQITKWCTGTCATGHTPDPSPEASALIVNAVSTPSLSGSSTELTVSPAPNATGGDVLYYTPSLGRAPLATNFVFDFWFMLQRAVWDPVHNTPVALHALEFDFNDFMPYYDYNFSSQCRLSPGIGNSVWQIWGTSPAGDGTTWIDSGVICHPEAFLPNTWHHVVWTYRIYPETLQTEYLALEIDGVLQPGLSSVRNPVQPRPNDRQNSLEVQFQQDAQALANPSPFTQWVDSVSLTYW